MNEDTNFKTVDEIRKNLKQCKTNEKLQQIPVYCSTYYGTGFQANSSQTSTSGAIETVDSNNTWLQNFGSYPSSSDVSGDTQTLDHSTSDPNNTENTDNNSSSTLCPRPFHEGYNYVGVYDPRPQFGNYSSQVGMPFNDQRMFQQYGYSNYNFNHPNQTWQFPQNQNMQTTLNYSFNNSAYPPPFHYNYRLRYPYPYPNQNMNMNLNLNQNYSAYQGWPRQALPNRLGFRPQGLNTNYGQLPTSSSMTWSPSQQPNTSTQIQSTNSNAPDSKNASNDEPKAGPSTSNNTSNEETGSANKVESRSRNRQRSHSREKSRRRSSSRVSRSRSSYSQRRSRSLSPARLRNTNDFRSNRFGYQSNRNERNRRPDFFKGRDDASKSGNERQKLIEKWRLNNCNDQDEMNKRLEALFKMKPDEIMAEENKIWIRSAPATCFYERDVSSPGKMTGTNRLKSLCDSFKFELAERGKRAREARTLPIPPPVKPKQRLCQHKSHENSSGHDSEATDPCPEHEEMNDLMNELDRKQRHPYRLHSELWFNDPGEMNDGPLCRCSAKARRSGIRHGFYAGEDTVYTCDPMSNNAGKLYHYRITISPPTNFLTRCPTIINYDDHEFIFEGFSLISHYRIEKLPVCKVIRFNIEYIILYVEEKCPENFCIEEIDLFYNFLFKEILELMDFELHSPTNKEGCPQFHFMPRFVRELPDNGRELLPMCEVLNYMLRSNQKLFDDDSLPDVHKMSKTEWQNFADSVKGMIVTNPGMKPSSIRVDQIDRETDEWLKNQGKRDEEKKRGSRRRGGRFSPSTRGSKSDDSCRGNKSDDSQKSSDSKGSRKRGRRGRKNRRDSSAENSSHKKSENLRRGTPPTKGSSREKSTTPPADKNTSTRDKPESSGEGRRNGNNGSNKSNNKGNSKATEEKFYPEIVHFGIRPPQLSYAGNPEYQKAWRKYVKLRHLIANMAKPTAEDKRKLQAKESNLHAMRAHNKMKRDVTVTVSSKGFYLTGLMCDIVQHAMLIPILVCHLRFHRSLHVLEETIQYKFKDKFLLQLALTHPSYRENFGTNSDHARNSLTNCGIRQPKYGDKRIHYMNTRKRGINTLINIMSRFGKKSETQSNIYHNERLEFLGDAVVEFITSTHLFHIFRDLEEGGLATYRAALVQNQHLAVLAQKLNLDAFMLYAHGSDLCHDLELKHAMANCFEALMGALFLDGGIEAPDKVLANVLYDDDADCLDVWTNYPPHILQEQEPMGDRKWIPHFPFLQKLTEFEEATGIEFNHIRLLARAFTDRSVGFTNLTLGSNQRLEFLGDSVLQLISSEYLYKYFPEHHEGHLSLLRSSLVNNKTQSVVCDDLGMTNYALYANPKVELKVKDRADLLEAFLGALFVDNGLEVCRVFCDVCFFPRLQLFIMNQDWNDPKSKLQQCCLTLRTMDNTEPDIPVYKVVECKGPTNTRVYTVAVYFRNKRLAKATGHSIQQAEMNAAQKAMEDSGSLFPQLDHQKRVIAKSMRNQRFPSRSWSSDNTEESQRNRSDRERDMESD